jgi:hypothetical protein
MKEKGWSFGVLEGWTMDDMDFMDEGEGEEEEAEFGLEGNKQE